jgi:quinol monooxygenase YgiN
MEIRLYDGPIDWPVHRMGRSGAPVVRLPGNRPAHLFCPNLREGDPMSHTLPWSDGPAARSSGGEVVVMASRLKLKSLLRVPRFFLLSGASYRQAQRSPGNVGVSLRADPWRRTFWTLSSWENRQALQAYVGTEPHLSVMTKLKPAMRESLFTSWKQDPAVRPSWEEADRRLAVQEQARRSAEPHQG